MIKMLNNKLYILIFVALLLVSSVSAANYYISTTSSGTATGDSWINKMNFRNLNTESLQPGDIVYIDGGTNGLTYEASPFLIYSRGTPDKYIIFTRGKETGHNGQPTFQADGTYKGSSILFEGAWYVELSNIRVMAIGSSPEAIRITYRWLSPAVDGSNIDPFSHHIDILHNDIELITGTGIHMETPVGVRIMYNNIYTSVIDTTTGSDGIWGGMVVTDLEIAHNYFLLQNRATGSTAHKDFLQLNGLAGTTKIHDNFFRATVDSYQAIYGGTSAGNILIYNNIIDFTGTDVEGSMINLVNDSTKYLSAEVYNNVFIGTGQNNIGFYEVDNLVFKNNLIKMGLDTAYHIEVNMRNNNYNNAHFDYNQYDIPNQNALIGPGTWATWRSSTCNYQDVHSELLQNPTNEIKLYKFVNAPSLDPAGYKLASGSSGINEGTPISGITDDFVGTSRPQGAAWDIGAYEYVSGAQCDPADTNCDSCISLSEISSYVSRWLQGSVTLPQASSAVSTWMKGC